ncbi:hypothetical protein, partial [Pantoea sp.]|uniref:hypothetical protein n=1 Tax=Pantoea sp. TaxID=69393 RepID=UPI0028A80FB5
MNLKEFASALSATTKSVPEATHSIVKQLADATASIARSEIGTYQEAVGEFPAWQTLAEATEEDKARHGYPLDAPLERTGQMRDSIKSEAEGAEARAGSDDEKLFWHENGTSKMPPRPVIGPAAIRATEHIEPLI